MTKALRPAGVVGLGPDIGIPTGGRPAFGWKSIKRVSPRIIQGPPAPSKNLSIDTDRIYQSIIGRVQGVVDKAGRIASGSARERAPVRKIFKGGRRRPPRYYTLDEARAELPAFLRSMGRSSNMSIQDVARTGRARGAGMTRDEALAQLRATPISTSRNRANSWQRTGQPHASNHMARDHKGNLRRDFNGNVIFAAKRDLDWEAGRDRLFNSADEAQLTTRGWYELRQATLNPRRAVSFSADHKEKAEKYGKFKTEADVERFKRSLDVPGPDDIGQLGGKLRRSISLRKDGVEGRVKVSIVAGGRDAPYARFVEFGTRHAAAQPFLRPALKHVEGPYKAMMRDAFPGSR